jgi:hypothetical protein
MAVVILSPGNDAKYKSEFCNSYKYDHFDPE